jgi:hypothetical protein
MCLASLGTLSIDADLWSGSLRNTVGCNMIDRFVPGECVNADEFRLWSGGGV